MSDLQMYGGNGTELPVVFYVPPPAGPSPFAEFVANFLQVRTPYAMEAYRAALAAADPAARTKMLLKARELENERFKQWHETARAAYEQDGAILKALTNLAVADKYTEKGMYQADRGYDSALAGADADVQGALLGYRGKLVEANAKNYATDAEYNQKIMESRSLEQTPAAVEKTRNDVLRMHDTLEVLRQAVESGDPVSIENALDFTRMEVVDIKAENNKEFSSDEREVMAHDLRKAVDGIMQAATAPEFRKHVGKVGELVGGERDAIRPLEERGEVEEPSVGVQRRAPPPKTAPGETAVETINRVGPVLAPYAGTDVSVSQGYSAPVGAPVQTPAPVPAAGGGRFPTDEELGLPPRTVSASAAPAATQGTPSQEERVNSLAALAAEIRGSRAAIPEGALEPQMDGLSPFELQIQQDYASGAKDTRFNFWNLPAVSKREREPNPPNERLLLLQDMVARNKNLQVDLQDALDKVPEAAPPKRGLFGGALRAGKAPKSVDGVGEEIHKDAKAKTRGMRHGVATPTGEQAEIEGAGPSASVDRKEQMGRILAASVQLKEGSKKPSPEVAALDAERERRRKLRAPADAESVA
jgi:hypothetical protein